MSWNYRIVKRKYPKSKLSPAKTLLSIHETYYDKKSKPTSITKNAILGGNDDLTDLEWTLKKMLRAVRRVKSGKDKILKYEDF